MSESLFRLVSSVCLGNFVSIISLTGDRWNKLQLTYRFLGYTPDLPRSTIRNVFVQAFKVKFRRAVQDKRCEVYVTTKDYYYAALYV